MPCRTWWSAIVQIRRHVILDEFFFISAHRVRWDGDFLVADTDVTVGHELACLLHGCCKSLVVDLCLKSAVEDVLGAERKNVVEGRIRCDESFVVKRTGEVVDFTLYVSGECRRDIPIKRMA